MSRSMIEKAVRKEVQEQVNEEEAEMRAELLAELRKKAAAKLAEEKERIEKSWEREGKKKLKEKAKEMADEIMKETIFKTARDNEEIYYYNDGTYHSNGEVLIKEMLGKKFGEEITKNMAAEVVFQIQTRTYFNRFELNKDKHLIFLRNGIFDLKKIELKPFDPDIMSISSLPVKYDPDADCPKIKQFLSDVLSESDIPIIQELFGYCLWREYHIQKAFMFIGDGSNGKSTVLSLLCEFLGRENITNISLQDLIYKRFAVASLYGKLANIYADIPFNALHQTGVFKMLTGGDPISAEQKFKDYFNFVNYAKLIFSANRLPEAVDTSSAFFRRWILINFPNKFEGDNADKNILKKLTTEEELSGLFNWAVAGLRRLLEQGNFSYSESTDSIQEKYERMSNSFLGFVKDCVVMDPENYVPKEEFYRRYVEYCKKMDLPSKSMGVVSKAIFRYLPSVSSSHPRIDGKKVHCWKGINFGTPSEKIGTGGTGGTGRFIFKINSNLGVKKEEKKSYIKLKEFDVPVVPVVPPDKFLELIPKTEPIDVEKLVSEAIDRKIIPITNPQLGYDLIEKLKREGLIFEQTPGKVRRV